MSAAMLSHRILSHHFLPAAPPPPRPPTTTIVQLKRRFHSPLSTLLSIRKCNLRVVSCLSSSSSSSSSPPPPPPCPPPPPKARFNPSTRLFVSGLSFRTTEESLRKAFENFGELVEVNLVMDNIAKRPRGFAFIRYAMQEEAKKAIEGMHGKFLDGRVIFVEVAKSRAELRQGFKQNPR